jgi:glycolate oxidase FAD binding subunit
MSVATDLIEEIQQAVRQGPRVLPHGGRTKPALSAAPDGVAGLDVSRLSGIVDYDPSELTFTALAGTPVAQVEEALGEHGQYLPFDPPLADAGATLGGVVAAGTSGANAFRYGGVRDFIIGVQFVDGAGRLITAGGKVVKNAAGFDLPKLMVGSMGRLGVLVRLSFKVFPRPPATTTVRAELGSTEAALAVMAQLGRGPVDLDALDLEPPGTLVARVGGAPEILGARVLRLEAALGATAEQLEDEQDADYWRAAAAFDWIPAASTLVKVGSTPRRIPGLEVLLAAHGATARHSLGGNVAWVAWPAGRSLEALDSGLRELELAGMVLQGEPGCQLLLGRRAGGAFDARIRAAIDPSSRFLGS